MSDNFLSFIMICLAGLVLFGLGLGVFDFLTASPTEKIVILLGAILFVIASK